MKTVEVYLLELEAKGFHLSEEARGFILFGKTYTGASDALLRVAIEATLKHQRQFDGSYFIGILENLKREGIVDEKKAQAYVRKLALS